MVHCFGSAYLSASWAIDGVGVDIAAFDALTVFVEFMGVSIRANGQFVLLLTRRDDWAMINSRSLTNLKYQILMGSNLVLQQNRNRNVVYTHGRFILFSV